jgi:hypothetical protein
MPHAVHTTSDGSLIRVQTSHVQLRFTLAGAAADGLSALLVSSLSTAFAEPFDGKDFALLSGVGAGGSFFGATATVPLDAPTVALVAVAT